MKKIIVAIDGFSSCGKSTMAKALASYAGYKYVDTGAMYRAVGLYGLEHGFITATSIDEQATRAALPNIKIDFCITPEGQHTMLNGVDVEALIRTPRVADAASRVSTIGFVRSYLVDMQRAMGDEKGVVMDGRDIGTVVFPAAELKIFVTSRPEVRAQRRYDELQQKGDATPYEAVLAQVVERDYRDSHRAESPLRQATDARLLDNSDLTREAQFDVICSWFNAIANN